MFIDKKGQTIITICGHMCKVIANKQYISPKNLNFLQRQWLQLDCNVSDKRTLVKLKKKKKGRVEPIITQALTCLHQKQKLFYNK